MKLTLSSPGELITRLMFFEWAYGCLGEGDNDIGPLAEFLVGTALKRLPARRKAQGVYDLVTASGTTLEIKATSRMISVGKGKKMWRWTIRDQQRSFDGKHKIADWWIFLKAEFPPELSSQRFFNVFDPAYWTAYLVRGEALLATKVRVHAGETTLRRAGAITCTIPELANYIA
jgi:hypothetical protein